jgi:hypothetical protein
MQHSPRRQSHPHPALRVRTQCGHGISVRRRQPAKSLILWWAHTRTLDPLIKSQLLYAMCPNRGSEGYALPAIPRARCAGENAPPRGDNSPDRRPLGGARPAQWLCPRPRAGRNPPRLLLRLIATQKKTAAQRLLAEAMIRTPANDKTAVYCVGTSISSFLPHNGTYRFPAPRREREA